MLWRGQLHTNKTQRNRYGKQIRDKFYHIYQVVPNVDNEVGNKGLIWARFFFRPRTAKYDNAPRYSWIENSFRYSWSNSVRILRQYPGGSYVLLNILPLKLQFSVERSKSIFLQNINQLLFKTDFVFNNYSTFFTVNKSRYGSFQCGNHIATENIQCFLLILPFNLSGSRCFTFTKKFEQETCLFSWSRLM